MKKLMKFSALMFTLFFVSLLFIPAVFGQEPVEPGEVEEVSWIMQLLSSTLGVYVITFLAFVTAVTTLTSLIGGWFKKDGWFKQKLSWFIAVAVAMLAWVLNLGLFDPVLWWEAILIGVCGGLVANGVFDIPALKELLKKIGLERLPI